MTRYMAFVVLCLVAVASVADCYSHKDALSTTRIRCDDGTTGQIHRDSFGDEHGHIGDRDYRSHADAFGNKHGRLGDKNFDAHKDAFGDTHAQIGDKRFSRHTDAFGNTHTHIGNPHVETHHESR